MARAKMILVKTQLKVPHPWRCTQRASYWRRKLTRRQLIQFSAPPRGGVRDALLGVLVRAAPVKRGDEARLISPMHVKSQVRRDKKRPG